MPQSTQFPNLGLAALAQAYQTTALQPLELLLQLRQQALALSDKNLFIYLLSEAEIQHYTEALAGRDPASLPLYGVPFAIKDNIDLAGVPTTAACPAFAYTPSVSAPLVQALINAGAIPLGKTNLDQFATGLVGTRSPYGEVPNAFVPAYISGGSSSGSAVALALGLVSFALGTDTAGSGRVPAALNNLIGLKPTKGLFSTTGLTPACRSLDCISLFTLNCDDAADLFDRLATFDATDAYARPNTYTNRRRFYGATPECFTFGLLQFAAGEISDDAQTAYTTAAEHLSAMGGKPVTLDFSPFAAAARLLYQGPWVAERQLATQGVAKNAMLPVIQTILAGAEGQTAAHAFAAQYQLAALKRQCDQLLEGLDFVLTPTIPRAFTRAQIAADPIGCNSQLGTFTNFMNLLDYSALAVPATFNAEGLPWGVTLFSHPCQDVKLLNFGRALHQLSGLPQGTSQHAPPQHALTPMATPPGYIDLVVCGAHLNGQPLNWQLRERGATLKAATTTAKGYRLFALPDGKRPALVRHPGTQAAIQVEVWTLPAHTLGTFVAAIPPPLGIGKTQLADGSWVTGFICEEQGLADAQDITDYGGWRAWLAARG